MCVSEATIEYINLRGGKHTRTRSGTYTYLLYSIDEMCTAQRAVRILLTRVSSCGQSKQHNLRRFIYHARVCLLVTVITSPYVRARVQVIYVQ